jgi:dihydrofolate synthase/folylpolyglutamate synthase
VIAIMKDKDAAGLLAEYAETFTSVIATQVASTDRGMPAAELGELAAGVFGADRVQVVPRLDDAIEAAIAAAEIEGATAPGVVITGSVVAVGEARTLLVGRGAHPDRPQAAEVTGEGVLGATAVAAGVVEDEDEDDEKDWSYGPEYGEQFDDSDTVELPAEETGPEDSGAYGPLADDSDEPGGRS